MSYYADRCIDFTTVDIKENLTAEHVMPGDWFCSYGHFVRVLKVRYVNDDRTGHKDTVVFEFDADDHTWYRTQEMSVDSTVVFAREKTWGQKKTW